MAGTNGRRAVVKPAAVRVGELVFWCSTRPNAAILEQTINSIYAGEPAELDLHPDVHVNPSHERVFALLDAAGLTRIPDDGEESGPGPADTTAPEESAPEESAPEPVKPAATRTARRTTTTTTGGRRRATGA